MTTCTPPTRSFTSRTFIGGLNRFVCFLRGWESKTNGFKFQSERAGALALCGPTTSRHPERCEGVSRTSRRTPGRAATANRLGIVHPRRSLGRGRVSAKDRETPRESHAIRPRRHFLYKLTVSTSPKRAYTLFNGV